MEPTAALKPQGKLSRESGEPIAARLASLTAENYRLTLRVKVLEAQLQARAIIREALSADPEALSLFQDRTVASADVPPDVADGSRGPPARSRPMRHKAPLRRPLDPALPREVIQLPDPPQQTRRCPLTGAPLLPGFTQALEVLARKPAVYFVKRYERTVWVSPAKSAPLTTPWPADVLPRSGVHASVVAHIAAAHFSEHVPYYRLEHQLARTGVHLSRSTQVSLMAQLDALVRPLADHIQELVLQSGYVHLDATPVDVCDPARPGAARSATLWTYRARSRDPAIDGLVWYEYQPTKSPQHPRGVFHKAAYSGVIQTDGASGLDALGLPERVTHVGCWAHARRYFVEAVKVGEPTAAGYLAQIDRLFRIDARARQAVAAAQAETRLTRAERVGTWRARFSVPLAERLFRAAAQHVVALPPKSALAVALGYLLGQRAPLKRCVTTTGAVLDNNWAENAIRPLKLGAKNWLFIGHPDAGPRLAHLFTLVENARQAKVDIEAYLIALVSRLPASSIRRLGDWLPRTWQQAYAVGIIY